jgi:hypothetical protein
MMLRLDPPWPVAEVGTGRKGLAHVLIDYGVEFNLVFVVVFDDNGEIWSIENKRLRAQENITFGRNP